MGRGSIGVAEAPPRMVAERGGDDHRLVAAVRRGDDRAFELLYSRYHRRIHAYVLGMVRDHGRAEDTTQEVFMSALRRMRETERPIAFKPWIYEIAKNACIDQFRRSRRAEEVSLQADEGFAPGDYGKLVGSEPTPEAAVAAKQDLDHLCGAFGGLSDTHHEILVLRELEGLSYREIGERMGMSRPAVESTLFRARRRLTEEYDDLVSGARCLRIRELIESAASGRLGARESRRLSRHVVHCQPCRREAMAAGLDSAILTHVPLHRRAAEKIAALLPFPLFGRGGGASHVPMLSEQAAGGWGKLATAAAVLVAGIGATGAGTHVAGPDARGSDRARPAQERAATAPRKAGTGQARQSARASARGTGAERRGTESRRSDRGGDRGDRRDAGSGATLAASSGGEQPSSGGDASGAGGGLPDVGASVGSGDPAAPVRRTVEGANQTVDRAGETVESAGQTAEPVVDGVQQTVEEATAPVQETVDSAEQTVEDTTGADLPLP